MFDHSNDMNPFHMNDNIYAEYSILPELSKAEQRLIALRTIVQSVYRLKGGSYGCVGHVVNLVQNVQTFISKLPRQISDIGMVIVRKRMGENIEDFKDFKVNKNSILIWLNFLIKYNPLYKDIEIDFEYLNIISENNNDNFSIYSQLNTVNEEELENVVNAVNNVNDNNLEPQNLGPGQLLDRINDTDNVLESILATPFRDTNTVHTNLNTFIINGNNNENDNIHNEENLAEENQINEQLIVNEEHKNDNHEINDDNNIPWPEVETHASCEYKTPHLLAGTWPHLFPLGIGDVTYKSRNYFVSFHEACQHYLKYSIRKQDGTYFYPFVEDPNFVMYIQDVDERNRIMQQANVYISQNLGDANMTLNQLRNPQQRSIIMKRMHKFGANILGSPSHLYRERRKLEELIKQKGCPTIWMTLTFADKQWQDLYQVIEITQPLHLDNEGILKWRQQLLLKNPHIAKNTHSDVVIILLEVWPYF
jgi:hypothetical protein